MPELFNIYCDESCHLEHDASKVMVLGAVWCPAVKIHSISKRIREIKKQHGVSREFQIKWIKVSPAQELFYLALIDYFFDDDDLHFRGVLIPDKSQLNNAALTQNHDDWYYTICFDLLEPVIDPQQAYCVYLDIKDTRSETKRANLEQILRSSRSDHSEAIIRKVQQIRSRESAILQLTDLLIGAVSYANRQLNGGKAKLALIDRIRERSQKRLDISTWLREPKFNLQRWITQGGHP